MGNIIHFYSKPRHLTPQIDHLRKTNTVLRVSTHIYRVSHKTDGKMFIFRVNLGHVTPQNDCIGKTNTVLRVSAHIYWVSFEIDGNNMFFFTVNLGM